MSDYGTMQTRIRRELNRDGLTADIRDAIDSSINYYESDRFFFNEYSASVGTVTGSVFVTAPTASLEIDLINIVVSDNKRVMIERNYIDLESRAESTGEPTDYAEFNDLIRIYPVADKEYTMYFFGKQQLTEVSSSSTDAATNAWMTDGEVMVRSKAKEYIYEHRLRNSEQGAKMRGLAEVEWRRLKKKTDDKIASGELKAFRF